MTTAKETGIGRTRGRKTKRGTYRVREVCRGNAPQPREQAVILRTFEGFPCPHAGYASPERWELYLRPLKSSTHGWWNLKLVAARGPLRVVRAKANYWISWHKTEERWAAASDVARLRNGRPELFAAVEETLKTPIGDLIGDFEFESGIAPSGRFPVQFPLYIHNRGLPGSPPGVPHESTEEDLL